MRKIMLGALALSIAGLGAATAVNASPPSASGLTAAAVELARGGPDRLSGEGQPFKELRQQTKGKSSNG